MNNDILKISLLIDFYGKLLTQKQQIYLNDYYFKNFSLSEIAKTYCISKNAIYDAIKKSIIELENYDNKLKLIDGFNNRIKIYKKINLDKKIMEELLSTEVIKYAKKIK